MTASMMVKIVMMVVVMVMMMMMILPVPRLQRIEGLEGLEVRDPPLPLLCRGHPVIIGRATDGLPTFELAAG